MWQGEGHRTVHSHTDTQDRKGHGMLPGNRQLMRDSAVQHTYYTKEARPARASKAAGDDAATELLGQQGPHEKALPHPNVAMPYVVQASFLFFWQACKPQLVSPPSFPSPVRSLLCQPPSHTCHTPKIVRQCSLLSFSARHSSLQVFFLLLPSREESLSQAGKPCLSKNQPH